MRPHGRGIQEQTAGLGEGLGLQVFPQARPDPTRFPAPEAHVNGMPVTQFGRQIPPRAARAIEMEHRFQELPIAALRRCSRRRVFGLGQSHLELFPRKVADQFSDFGFRYPKFQSPIAVFVHTIIREHCLALKGNQGTALTEIQSYLAATITAGDTTLVHCE